MRRHEHDGSVRPQPGKPIAEKGGRLIIQAGEWFVEQYEARTVKQRSLERQPLTKAPRKSRHPIVGALRQPGGAEGFVDRAVEIVDSVEGAEERQVLARAEVAIEEEIVTENADLPAKVIAKRRSRLSPEVHRP